MRGQLSSRRTTGLRRALRSGASDAERNLWQRLRNRQVGGHKFRRQESVGPYVVDFFCQDALLVVEVDGGHHFESPQRERDDERSAYLRSLGMRVLRFDNRQVLTEPAGVLESILLALTEPPSP